MVSISIFCMCCVFLCFFSSYPISRGLNTVMLLGRYVALKYDAKFYTQGLPSSFSRTSVRISVHMVCISYALIWGGWMQVGFVFQTLIVGSIKTLSFKFIMNYSNMRIHFFTILQVIMMCNSKYIFAYSLYTNKNTLYTPVAQIAHN